MLFKHHTDTTITPDSLFEAKDPFEDSRIFIFLEIPVFTIGNPYMVSSPNYDPQKSVSLTGVNSTEKICIV